MFVLSFKFRIFLNIENVFSSVYQTNELFQSSALLGVPATILVPS